MTAKVLMVQGTGSDVGKSIFVAGLCRILKNRGFRVAPFKPQNMSNNAAVAVNGGEIGRAQAVQAYACGIPPHTDMNPMLLKPEADNACQVVVSGQVVGQFVGVNFATERMHYLPHIAQCFKQLCSEHDYVIVEGAGSPAEVNLREGDIANMGFAEHVDIPVCLLADIDRGGVIAAIVGTHALLPDSERNRIASFIVNKFRGDLSLFQPAIELIEERTSWKSSGVLPWLSSPSRLPSEDTVVDLIKTKEGEGVVRIAAPMLSRMANFDDADPLRFEPNVDFQFVRPGDAIPMDVDVVILFGSKATIAELAFVRQQGWHHDIIAHVRKGGLVFGICGGYQMLGMDVLDPELAESKNQSAKGLGLLNVSTTMRKAGKQVEVVTGHSLQGDSIEAYEIHIGDTTGPDTQRPLFSIDGRDEGAQSISGNVQGTYLHSVFANDDFRRTWLNSIKGSDIAKSNYWHTVDAALDELAADIETSVNVDQLFEMASQPAFT